MARPTMPSRNPCSLALFCAVLALSIPAQAQNQEVLSALKISDTAGAFGGILTDQDRFGRSVTLLGDLNADGVPDLAVGPHRDDEGGFKRGSAWVLLMNADGTVVAEQKISSVSGGFTGVLDDDDNFGFGLCGIGDLDADGIPDMAVTAYGDDDLNANSGAVWILFLQSDGSVRDHAKISGLSGGLTNVPGPGDNMGRSIALLGDLNGDGSPEIAVGAPFAASGGFQRGEVYVLFLTPTGTVEQDHVLSDASIGLPGGLVDGDRFGFGITGAGDLNLDGIPDLVVGATQVDDGGTDRGAIFSLLLDSSAGVLAATRISQTSGGFGGALADNDQFGSGVAMIGNLNGSTSTTEIAVGVPLSEAEAGASSTDAGAIWVLSLDNTGACVDQFLISELSGDLGVDLANDDRLGVSLGTLGDFDGNGVNDIFAGASRTDDGGSNRGAVYLLLLEPNTPQVARYGSGVNPVGSLTLHEGQPDILKQVQFGIENPFGTQAPGSPTFLFLSFAPDPSFPAGNLLSNFGMSAPGTSAELLVDLNSPNFIGSVFGTGYGGPGQPGFAIRQLPNNPSLVGLSFFAQGYVFDSAQMNGSGVRFGLTDALQLTIGQ